MLVRMKPTVAECLMNDKSWPIAPLAASDRNVGFRESCGSIVQRNRS